MLNIKGKLVSLDKPLVMGILNITPDSFSDGGQFFTPEKFEKRVRELWALHVGIIDVGAESSAPQNSSHDRGRRICLHR